MTLCYLCPRPRRPGEDDDLVDDAACAAGLNPLWGEIMSYLAWLRPEGNLRSAACQRPPPPLQYPPLFPPTPSPPGRGSSSAPRLPCVSQTAPSRFLCCCFRARCSRSCPARRSCRTGGLTPSCCTAVVCFVVSVRIMRRVFHGVQTPTDHQKAVGALGNQTHLTGCVTTSQTAYEQQKMPEIRFSPSFPPFTAPLKEVNSSRRRPC